MWSIILMTLIGAFAAQMYRRHVDEEDRKKWESLHRPIPHMGETANGDTLAAM